MVACKSLSRFSQASQSPLCILFILAILGFLLATIKSSDLWNGFVVGKILITGLNKILYQIFSKSWKQP
jgi:hypothetical protein